ncbi:AraC family transcriptional regulator [Bordetella petrii]|uniref:AraC family transcriptional regulator n=1 Tax=Bordetella petrii TaxID=94624 RepID=UPI0037310052
MAHVAVPVCFDPDRLPQPAIALQLDVRAHDEEAPIHTHRKGQLVIALRGGVTSEVPGGLWMVPPHCGVWIPGGVPHSNRITPNGRVCFLLVEPSAAALPQACCTLSLTPLVRELILHLAQQPHEYAAGGATARLVAVLLEQLAQMPTERLYLPISTDPRLRRIAGALTQDPGDRRTLAEWGARVAMSERSLARMVLRETGMTFGRWRQQLQLIAALQRLSSGVSVQRTADDLGYESVSAFITMFKKALGKSPARYFADRRDGP